MKDYLSRRLALVMLCLVVALVAVVPTFAQMPTPVGSIINASQTISDSYVAAAAFFSMIALFVAFAYGKGIISWLSRLAIKLGRK